jgi:hypothetical protein
MRKTWVLVIVILSLSLAVTAGEYLVNDTGETVTGLRVTFSEPVTITGFGDTLMIIEALAELGADVCSNARLRMVHITPVR